MKIYTYRGPVAPGDPNTILHLGPVGEGLGQDYSPGDEVHLSVEDAEALSSVVYLDDPKGDPEPAHPLPGLVPTTTGDEFSIPDEPKTGKKAQGE